MPITRSYDPCRLEDEFPDFILLVEVACRDVFPAEGAQADGAGDVGDDVCACGELAGAGFAEGVSEGWEGMDEVGAAVAALWGEG